MQSLVVSAGDYQDDSLQRMHTSEDPEKKTNHHNDHRDDEMAASKSKEEIDPPPISHPHNNRESTLTDDESPLRPPPLSFSPWSKKTSIVICVLGLLFFDLAMPCIIYYTLSSLTSITIEVNLGVSCASLGLGEMMELPLRAYRLVKYRSQYAPLGQTSKWGFDFLFWWYGIASLIGIVPYVMSTSLDQPILWMFLMTPGFLTAFAVLTTGVSAFAFRLPVRVSSDAKGERCKPFVYYVMEDFIAVDAGQMRAYREELKARWNASPVFRTLIWDINLWWTAGGIIFTGALAGMTWGLPFNTAYGLSLGLLFVWIGLWALGTWWLVERGLQRERLWYEKLTTAG